MKSRWIRRIRNSHGYGIQSPNDFYFVQHILHETTPYYRYTDLHHLAQRHSTNHRHYTEVSLQLLFRLANYVQPQTIVEVGAESLLPSYAITLGCPTGQCIRLNQKDILPDAIPDSPQIIQKKGDELLLFEEIQKQLLAIDLLHIAHTPYYSEIVKRALPHVSNKSLFVIEGIRDTPEKHTWWEQLQNQHTGISYDLKTTGLLFFDKTRYKNAYWINIRKQTSL